MKNEFTVEQIQQFAVKIRRHVVQMAARGKTSHVGSALSCVDLLTALYFRVMNIHPARWQAEDCDRFILSKGHGVMAWFATLAERGFFDPAMLAEYCVDGGRLGEHPEAGTVPGITVTTGSLGHGLSIGLGIAMAKRMKQSPSKVFVILSDGECNEGSIWEAAMYAAHQRAENLVVLVDDNQMQAMGKSFTINAVEPLGEKWKAFGWAVKEINGHRMEEILETCAQFPLEPGKPTAIIAHTLLGKGVSYMEDRILWHYQIPSEEQVKVAMGELVI